MSHLWGENPTILACGHLCEPMAGIRWLDGTSLRECRRCGTWETYVKAPDLDLLELPSPPMEVVTGYSLLYDILMDEDTDSAIREFGKDENPGSA